MCIQPRPRGHRCCCCQRCRGDDRMVSWRSKPRVGRYVFSGACPILSVSNSGSTQQKRTLKIAMGKKSPVRFCALGLCFADHRSRKYRNFRHAYQTPDAHNLALNTQNRDVFEFYKCLVCANDSTLCTHAYLPHTEANTHTYTYTQKHRPWLSQRRELTARVLP